MPNDHSKMKKKIESKYGKSNVLWGDEVSDVGIAAAGVGAYFGVTAGFEYFKEKISKFKKFGLDAVKFLSNKGDPKNYRIRFDKINIDHWETVKNPFTGKKKKIYIKRSYRYYMAVRKK